MENQKDYQSPLSQVINLESEAILCISGPDYSNAGSYNFDTTK